MHGRQTHVGNGLDHEGLRPSSTPVREPSTLGDSLLGAMYAFGYGTLGPVFGAFGRLLLARASERGIRRLAFVARDGHFLLAVARTLCEQAAQRGALDLRYVHLSRRSTTLAAFDIDAFRRRTEGPRRSGGLAGLVDLRLGRWIEDFARGRVLDFLFQTMNLSPEPFRPVLERFDLWTPRTPPSEERIAEMIRSDDFIRCLEREKARQKELLRGYLTQEGFFQPGKLALVDIGWRGQTQSDLEDAFAQEGLCDLSGFYLALWQEFNGDGFRHLEKKEGLISDARRGFSVFEGAPYFVSYLLEAVCRAPEGTTLGYFADTENVIRPVLSGESGSREAEMTAEPLLSEIRKGILDHVRGIPPEAGVQPGSRSVLSSRARRLLLRLAFFPNKTEIELATRLVHTEHQFEGWHGRLLPENPASPLRQPRAWLRGLNTPWRTGYMAQTGGLAFSLISLAAEAALLSVPGSWKRAAKDLIVKFISREAPSVKAAPTSRPRVLSGGCGDAE